VGFPFFFVSHPKKRGRVQAVALSNGEEAEQRIQ
jgi:hypothetical protein